MKTVIVDGSCAWGAVVGGFIANFILGGLSKSYGIIMEHFQEEFQAPTAIFTLTGGIIYTLAFTLSLANHFIVQCIGDQAVVMIGGVSAFVSLLVAAMAPNVTVWAIAVGGGVGFAFSCVYFNIFSIIGRCFRKKLGLANGLSVAGVSVGQMVFPSLTSHLIHTYGVRGGTCIMSAFSLHLCVTAVLMPRHIKDLEAEEAIPVDSSSLNPKVEAPSSSGQSPTPGDSAVDLEADNFNRMSNDSDQSAGFLSPSKTPSKPNQEHLATALLIMYIVGKIFADNADVGISVIAPPYGSEIGYSAHITNMAIAVSGAVDLISRLLFGWLTDKPFLRGRHGILLATTWFFQSMGALAFGQLVGFPWHPIEPPSSTSHHKSSFRGPPTSAQTAGYFICFLVQGVCSGTSMTQMIVVLSDYVGPKRLAKSLAIAMVNLGLFYVPFQALIGHLNDSTGSYSWSMRLCSFMLFASALVFLLEFPLRCAARLYDAREKHLWNQQVEATTAMDCLFSDHPCHAAERTAVAAIVPKSISS